MNKTEKKAQVKRIIRMRDALVNDDKEEQKRIVHEHLGKMWVNQLSEDVKKED